MSDHRLEESWSGCHISVGFTCSLVILVKKIWPTLKKKGIELLPHQSLTCHFFIVLSDLLTMKRQWTYGPT